MERSESAKLPYKSRVWFVQNVIFGLHCPLLLGFTGTFATQTKQKSYEANSTQCSQAVTHPSTNSAQCCLTSVIGRELVYSTWYGRRHLQELTLANLKQKVWKKKLTSCKQTFWWNIFLANRIGLVICFHSQSKKLTKKEGFYSLQTTQVSWKHCMGTQHMHHTTELVYFIPLSKFREGFL